MIQLIVVHYNRQTIDCQHSNHLLWFTARKPIQAELPSIYNAQCITIVWIIFKWIAHYIVFHFCFARVPTKSLFFFDYYFFYFFFIMNTTFITGVEWRQNFVHVRTVECIWDIMQKCIGKYIYKSERTQTAPRGILLPTQIQPNDLLQFATTFFAVVVFQLHQISTSVM